MVTPQNRVPTKIRATKRIAITLAVGGLAASGVWAASTAHAGYYGEVSRTAFFENGDRAAEFAANPSAGLLKQVQAQCVEQSQGLSTGITTIYSNVVPAGSGWNAEFTWTCT